ncbi:unnamed protein product [Chrysoparadoxa australica]
MWGGVTSTIRFRLSMRRASIKPGVRRLSNPLPRNEPQHLQRLPIPSLRMTVSRYLDSLRPLASDEEMGEAERIASEMMVEEGPSLQAELIQLDQAQAERGGYPHSYIESYWDDMYLEGRWALPINSNPYLVLADPPSPNTDAARASKRPGDKQTQAAAAFLFSHLKFLLDTKAGGYSESTAGTCSHQFPLQVGTARIPGPGRDAVHCHPNSKHVVVISNNRVFSLEVINSQGQLLSGEGLARELSRIKSMAHEPNKDGTTPNPAHYIGYMTGVDRNDWAAVRAQLERKSESNGSSLHTIDSALAVLGLDDAEVASPSHSSALFMHGYVRVNGHNRWFDKHQVVALRDGTVGVNYEHSFSDGMTWCTGLSQAWHDMHGLTPTQLHPLPSPSTFDNAPPPQEVSFSLPQEVASRIERARAVLGEAGQGVVTVDMDYQGYGRELIKRLGVSPDAGAQLAFQLAYSSLHGAMPPVYESCSTAAFSHGRTEVIRSCTSESKALVDIMSGNACKDTKLQLLAAAGAKHITLAKEAQQGQGVDRHLTMLKELSLARVSEAGLLFSAAAASSNAIANSNISLYLPPEPRSSYQTLPLLPVPGHASGICLLLSSPLPRELHLDFINQQPLLQLPAKIWLWTSDNQRLWPRILAAP